MTHTDMIEAVAKVAETKIRRERINFFDMEEIAWDISLPMGSAFDSFAETLSEKQKNRDNSLDDLIYYAQHADLYNL